METGGGACRVTGQNRGMRTPVMVPVLGQVCADPLYLTRIRNGSGGPRNFEAWTNMPTKLFFIEIVLKHLKYKPTRRPRQAPHFYDHGTQHGDPFDPPLVRFLINYHHLAFSSILCIYLIRRNKIIHTIK